GSEPRISRTERSGKAETDAWKRAKTRTWFAAQLIWGAFLSPFVCVALWSQAAILEATRLLRRRCVLPPSEINHHPRKAPATRAMRFEVILRFKAKLTLRSLAPL